jgi:hypothetical protein
MQFKILLVATTLAINASFANAIEGKFWCHANNGNCALPGIQGTYYCGESQGASHYMGAKGEIYWKTLVSWSDFVDCCRIGGLTTACRE